MAWSAEQYVKFEDERTRPARDLLAQVPLQNPRVIVDMGCGPGNSTELLVERYPEAQTIGLDSSPNMLKDARARLPSVTFDTADANSWTPGPEVDLVFANAIYQWVPGRLEVLPNVLAAMPPGGVLAVQMPDNLEEPSHRLMRETAAAGPWSLKLAGAGGARGVLHSPQTYYDLLRPFGARVDVWHTTYYHPLEGAPAIVDFLGSTALRPYLGPLDEEERARFLADYTERIAEAYPLGPGGTVLLRFPRLFIVAVR